MSNRIVLAGGSGLIGRSLSQFLKDRGYDPIVLDANAFRMTDEEIADAIRAAKPLLVGLSLYSDILRQVREMTRLIRQTAPQAKIVLGWRLPYSRPWKMTPPCATTLATGAWFAP